MPAITVRNLSAETHRAIKARAASHGRSTEAEVRAILDAAAGEGPRLGTLLASMARGLEGPELVIVRDKTPHEPIDFS